MNSFSNPSTKKCVEDVLDFTKTGTGLSTFINVGNTCYLNCALQVLMHMDDVKKIFLKTEKLLSDNPKILEGKDIKFYESLKAIYKGYWEDDCVIRPIGLVKYLNGQTMFSHGDQHDSTEVLTYVIQKIHESICVSKGKLIEETMSELEKNSISEWNYHLHSKNSQLVNMFWGQYYTRNKCNECGYKTKKFETFHYFSLQATIDNEENPESDIYLQDLLVNFLNKKKFDKDNKFFCEKCNSCVDDACHKTNLWKLPNYLIIQLKRYYNKADKKQIYKSHRTIQYPLEFNPVFLVDKNSSQREKFLTYKLHSGVFHLGGMYGGHYNCFSWNIDTQQWVGFDDHSRQQLEEPILVNDDIYQLVYKLEDSDS